MRPILWSNTQPGKVEEQLRRDEGSLITVIAGVILSAIIVLSGAWNLKYNQDARIYLTTSDTFSDWQGLRRVYDQAYNYSKPLNPTNLSGFVFEPTVDGLSQIDDLRNRRLMTDAEYTTLTAAFPLQQSQLLPDFQARLLRNLLRISWCSLDNARVGTTPTTRSPGCACIGQTYLDFLNETQTGVSVAATVINTTLATRTAYSERVLRCFDRRQVSRTSSCGKLCSVHALGLALYANSVFLLASWAFLQFSEYWRTFLKGFGRFAQTAVLKILVLVLGAALCVPYIITDLQANLLTITGIAISALYLTVSLHEELDFPGMDARKEHSGREYKGGVRKPHPLTVVLLMHLQLILPAYGVILASTGYARDVWAVISFAVTLGLMGVCMQASHYFFSRESIHSFFVWQRFFWAYWCNDRDDSVVNQTVLTGIFICLWVLLILLFIAYYYDGGRLYALGSIWVFAVFATYLFLMQLLLVADRFVSTFEERSFHWSSYQQGMYVLTLFINLFFGLVALWDTIRNEVKYSG